MAEQMQTHAIPTDGIEGVAVSEDGQHALLRFAGSPVAVSVPRSTLVDMVAFAIDASAERLTEEQVESAVKAVRVGRFTVGRTSTDRIVLGLETERCAGSVSFDLPGPTARQLAAILGAATREDAGPFKT